MQVKQESYSLLMRVANTLIGLLRHVGITPKILDADSITRKAIRKTGLSDLGDNMHREGMEELVVSANAQPLTHFGKFSCTGFGVEGVANRLRLIDLMKKNPMILETKIERPIFIIGFPRTGTTLLQNLLHLIDGRRALPFWEIINPLPLSLDKEEDIRLRKKNTDRRLMLTNFIAPEAKFIHDVQRESLEECWPLMISQFTIPNWDMTGRWREYGDWMLQHDMTRSYQEYKKYLQAMVNRVPDKRLILKCPDHLWHLDRVLEVFPDACIVWAHRDPIRSIASYCSMASLHWRLLYDRFDPRELGSYIEDRFRTGVERAMAVREQHGESSFFDVDFNDLQEDPISVVNRITDYFELETADNAAIRHYLDTDRPDNKGKHTYDANHYGLDDSRIREHFREYMSRFNIHSDNKLGTLTFA